MARRRTHWDKRLAEVIRPTGGPIAELVTLRDAARFVTELESWRQARPHWVYAGELVLRAGESGKAADIEEATIQMRRALRVEGWL